MPTVRAKFKVDSINRSHTTKATGEKDKNGNSIYGLVEMRTVVLSPVYANNDPEHENSKFWNASPSGKIELGCVNLAAAAHFELGQSFYVDFTAVEPSPE